MAGSAARAGMFSGLAGRHVGLIARFGARFAVRTGGGLVFLFLLVLTCLVVAWLFIAPVENILASPIAQEAGRERGREITTSEAFEEISKLEGFRTLVKWVTGGDAAQVDYLLVASPALLSTIFLVLLMLMPYLACFGGFNQTSGDIGNRGMRYLLLRTERANIFAGRFVATVLFGALYLAVMIALLLAYVGLKLQVYGWDALLAWGAQGYVAVLLLTLPYLALCSWISAAIDSPFGSLVLCLVVTGGPVAVLAGTSMVARFDFDTWARVLPWGWKYELLSGDAGTRLAAVGMMLVFTAFFFLLGLRTFHKRDL